MHQIKITLRVHNSGVCWLATISHMQNNFVCLLFAEIADFQVPIFGFDNPNLKPRPALMRGPFQITQGDSAYML